jgi:regulator of protease activity HflC (stomatin/prohibitin superfamily)
MDRPLQRLGLINVFALLAAAGGGVWLALHARIASGLAASAFLSVGLLVAVVSLFHLRLRARERAEEMELDELRRRTGQRAALFAETDLELRPARRAREQFERVIVPLFTALLVILEAAAVWVLWRHLAAPVATLTTPATLAMALFALAGLVLFLLGKYTGGLAKLEGQQLLRPTAAYLLLGAGVCFAVALAQAAVWFGFGTMDRWLGLAMSVALGVLATETALNLLLEIYRPRVAGQEARLIYESRLMDLAVRPEGLFRTAAQALDYQFGFRVSETWFYRFLERAIAWLILLQLALLFLFTTFVIIEPGEQALLERFGRPVAGREVLGPGWHFKLPWPVDTVHRHRTSALQQVVVGEGEDHAHAEEKVIIWAKRHNHDEANFLVASGAETAGAPAEQAVPVNLITVGLPVQFEVTNLVAWMRGHQDGTALLERVATRELTRYLVNADYRDLLAGGRINAGAALRERIQRQADELELGVRILFVGMHEIHPPYEVAAAYEGMVGADQEKATAILTARGESAESLPRARAEAAKKLAEAESQRRQRVAGLEARAAQFTNQLAAFAAAPTIYPRRLYLETVARATAPVRKLVIAATNTQEIVTLNLEDKLRADLFDVTLPPPPTAK